MGAEAWHCTAHFTWPPRGGVVPLGHKIAPQWSIDVAAGSVTASLSLPASADSEAEARMRCGAVCFTLNNGEALCRPPGENGNFELNNLLPGYHKMRLDWNDSDAGGAETWFHVSTARELANDTFRGHQLAHFIDLGVPVSISQFDDVQVMARAYLVDRYHVDGLKADAKSLAVDRTGEEAVTALAQNMMAQLLVQELRCINAKSCAHPSGSYYPLEAMLEGRKLRYELATFVELLNHLIALGDLELMQALQKTMEEAARRTPTFSMAVRYQLEMASMMRTWLETSVAETAIARALQAVSEAISVTGPPVRRRGDPRRPVGDVLLLTMATESTPELELLRRSASAVGLELIVDDGGAGGKWLGFGNRLLRMRKLLEGVEDNTLVLHVDAYDTLFLPTSAEDIAKRFVSAGADIVFNADAMCSPDGILEPLYPVYLAAQKAFLNAGAYIGRASDVRVMLDEVLDEMRQHEDEFDVDMLLENDQRMLTRYFLRHRGGACSYADYSKYGAYGGEHVALDVEQALVLTLHSRTIADMEISAENGSTSALLRYMPTGTMPFLLHGNGVDGKELLKVITEELGALGWPTHQ